MTFKKTLVAASLLAASAAVSAAPITGGFEFSISGEQVDTNADTIFDAFDFADFGTNADGVLDLDNSTGFINQPVTGTFLNNFGLQSGIVSYGDLQVRDIESFNPGGNNPLWTLTVDNGAGTSGLVSFNALSAASVDGGNPLDLRVNGILSFTADGACSVDCVWDDTASIWTLGSTGVNSVVGAVTVSEPASIALFGLGLAGLGLARRKQKAA